MQGVVVDVTETVELRNAMRMLVDHTLNDIVLVSWTDRAHARFEVIADGISRKCGYAGDALARMLEQRLCAEDSRTGRRMFDEVAGSIEAGADSTFVVEAAHLPFPLSGSAARYGAWRVGTREDAAKKAGATRRFALSPM